MMEFAPYGNLRDYLRRRGTLDSREPADVDDDVVDDVTSGDGGPLTYADLLSFAVQVARGLQFLTARLVSGRV